MKIKDKLAGKIPEEKRLKIKKALNIARVVKNVVCWTMIAVLSFAVITFLLSRVSGGTPSLFGHSIQRVSSGSMEPELAVGEVILSKAVDDARTLAAGEIITFNGQTQFGQPHITHRIIVPPYEENGVIYLQTKGDANETADAPITPDMVEFRFVCKLPFLAALYSLFLSPWGLILFIALLLVIFFDELLNIVHLVSGDYSEEEEESITEIIERLQREEREKKASPDLPESTEEETDGNDGEKEGEELQ